MKTRSGVQGAKLRTSGFAGTLRGGPASNRRNVVGREGPRSSLLRGRRDDDLSFHPVMSEAADDGAVKGECPRLVGGEFDGRGLTLF